MVTEILIGYSNNRAVYRLVWDNPPLVMYRTKYTRLLDDGIFANITSDTDEMPKCDVLLETATDEEIAVCT